MVRSRMRRFLKPLRESAAFLARVHHDFATGGVHVDDEHPPSTKITFRTAADSGCARARASERAGGRERENKNVRRNAAQRPMISTRIDRGNGDRRFAHYRRITYRYVKLYRARETKTTQRRSCSWGGGGGRKKKKKKERKPRPRFCQICKENPLAKKIPLRSLRDKERFARSR